MREYDTDFYDFLASFAVCSAQEIVPLLAGLLPVGSVVDFGCGQGAWLSVWRRTGAAVIGVDGPHIYRQHLLIGADEFHAADLGRPIDLGRRFDLVQSLEVAEHLPRQKAGGFIDVLTNHGLVVMFSAAVPGQGGAHHVNEQPIEYWRGQFRDRGYVAIDCIRPLVAGNPRVQSWYRCNIVVYVQEAHVPRLPERLRGFRVPDDRDIPDCWPLRDRLRHALVRQLPRETVDFLSRLKARREARKARSMPGASRPPTMTPGSPK